MTDPPYPSNPYPGGYGDQPPPGGYGGPPPGGYGGPPPGGYGGPPPGGYGGPPPGGYAIPPQVQDPTLDPLISPDYAGWWKRAIAIVKSGLAPLIQLQLIGVVAALALQVPIAIYSTILSNELNERLNNAPTDQTVTPEFGPLLGVLGLTLLTAFASIVVTAIVTIATIYVGVTIAVGLTPDLGTALRGAARRAFPLLGWQLLGSLLVLVGFCACVLPAFYVLAVITVLPAVVAFERGGVIGRCFKLFHGNLGTSIARMVTILGLTIGVGVVAGVIAGVTEAAFGSGSAGQLTVSIPGTLLGTLLTVLLTATLALFVGPLTLTAYADMRARVEPLNTAILAQELGLTPPQHIPPVAPTT
jgi:hypothetical protein